MSKQTKEKRAAFRIETDKLDQMHLIAVAAGVTTSQYIRLLVYKEIKKNKKLLKAMCTEENKSSNNGV